MPDSNTLTSKLPATSPELSPAVEDWRELAHQASEEPDGQKLVEMVRRLCDTLDQVEEDKKNQ